MKTHKEKQEKPVQIIPSTGKENKKHKTEVRIFARNIHESFCVQPGCKFKGKHAVQNVCHTMTTFNGSKDWSYIDGVLEAGEKHLHELQTHHKSSSKQEYIKILESHLACAWANTITSLDELIRLRGQVATLKHKNESISHKSKKRLGQFFEETKPRPPASKTPQPIAPKARPVTRNA